MMAPAMIKPAMAKPEGMESIEIAVMVGAIAVAAGAAALWMGLALRPRSQSGTLDREGHYTG